MDWNYVVEELRDVPDEFKEQRFYPLKHVVDIFSSGDPQGRTAEVGLSAQQTRLMWSHATEKDTFQRETQEHDLCSIMATLLA